MASVAKEEKIRDIVIEQLGVAEDEVTNTATLEEDLGADSLDMVELGMALEEEFDISLQDDDVAKVKTFADLVKLVDEQ